jgi:hypothetical protein
MASDRQIEANRRNSQLSTGPRTAEGKASSSRNASRHGLTAQTAFLPGEDEEEFASWRQELIAALDPSGALEFELAERIVSVLWRLRRVPQFEAALLTYLEEEARQRNATKARNELERRKDYRAIYHKLGGREKASLWRRRRFYAAKAWRRF